MDVFDDFKSYFNAFLSYISLKKFLIFGEIIILIHIIILSLSNGLTRYITSILFLFLIFIFISIGLLLLIYKHSIELIGLIAGFLLLSGIYIASIQIESLLSRGNIFIADIAFISNSIILIFLGSILIVKKIGVVSKKALIFMTWIFSILIILYLPISFIYFPSHGIGFGQLSSLILGVSFSIISIIMYLNKVHKEEIIKKLIIKGDIRRLSNDFKGAEKYYTLALDRSPNSYNINRLGDLYFSKGYYEVALSYYVNSLGYDKRKSYFKTAICYFFNGNSLEALRYIKESLSKSENEVVWYWTGRIFSDLGSVDKEKISYNKALELNSNYWPAIYQLSKFEEGEKNTSLKFKAIKKGGYDKKKKEILLSLENIGGILPVLIHPGDIRFWGKFEDEIDIKVSKILLKYLFRLFNIKNLDILEFPNQILGEDKNALNNNTNEDEIRLKKALIFASQGKLNDAIEMLSKLYGSNMKEEYFYVMAILKAKMGDYKDSLQLLDEIIDGKYSYKAKSAICSLHYVMNNKLKAKKDFKRLLKLIPYKSDILSSLEIILGEDKIFEMKSNYSRENYISFINSLTQLYNINIENILNLVDLRDYEKAFKLIQRIDHANNVVLYIKGMIQLLREKSISSFEIFNKILNEDQEMSEAHYCIGRSLLLRGKMKDALKEFKKALLIENTDPLYHLYLGITYLKLGETNKSREEFIMVKGLRPGWDLNEYYLSRAR